MTEIEVAIGILEERVRNLESWQKSQNGALVRLDERVEKLQWWIMTSAVGALISAGLMIASWVMK